MPLIPYAEPETASPNVAALWRDVPKLMNSVKMMAHADGCVFPAIELGISIATRTKADERHKLLATLAQASLERGEYQWEHNIEFARPLGFTDEQVAALEAGKVDADCFDATDRLVLGFTAALVKGAKAPAELVRELEAKIGPRAVVELVFLVSYQMFLARITESLGVENDGGLDPESFKALQTVLARG